MPGLPGGNPRSPPAPGCPHASRSGRANFLDQRPPLGTSGPSRRSTPSSTLEVTGKRLCSPSIHGRVLTTARGAESAECRQIGSLAECIWGGGSQVQLPAASRAPPRPSQSPAGSPFPHLLTAAPPPFSAAVAPAPLPRPPPGHGQGAVRPSGGQGSHPSPWACCAHGTKGLVRALGALGPPWQTVGREGLARIQAGLGREMARQLLEPVSPGPLGDSLQLCARVCVIGGAVSPVHGQPWPQVTLSVTH